MGLMTSSKEHQLSRFTAPVVDLRLLAFTYVPAVFPHTPQQLTPFAFKQPCLGNR
jgi:hypothetical protein